jgi:hypothetical protein
MALIRVDSDERNKIVRTVYGGVTTAQDLRKGNSVVMRFIDSHGAYSGITDLSAVTEFSVSGLEMRQLALLDPAIPVECKKVVVAPADITFGMSRMFQILSNQYRHNLYVVRCTEEAYQVLGVKSPEFSRLTGIRVA